MDKGARIYGPLKLALVMMAFFALGCASVKVPSYIQAEHPYKRTVYGTFEEVLSAVKEALKEEGWAISKETHPALYERNATYTEEDKDHALIFTETKQSSRLLYSNFSRLNIYVSRTKEGMEIDLRYGKVTDLYLKKIHRYRNDKLAERFLNLVEQKLLIKK
jgi:hypothetical protein